MAHSLTYNDIYLGDYGLYLTKRYIPFGQEVEYTQLYSLSLANDSIRTPRELELEFAVVAKPAWPPLPITPLNSLKLQVDAIRKALNERNDNELILDQHSDRYWLARLMSIEGEYVSPTLYTGTLYMICHDPAAYAVTETTRTATIDSDPKTITLDLPFGSDTVRPVYTLTAGEDLAAATIQLENTTTSEAIVWEGDIDNGEELAIDCPRWIVELEGSASMSDVSGQFPTLEPGTNDIKVTGFGSLGSLTITFRERYV